MKNSKKHILLALALTFMLAFGSVGVYAETAEGDSPAAGNITVEKADDPANQDREEAEAGLNTESPAKAGGDAEEPAIAEEDIAPIAEGNGIFKANGSTTMEELINVANGTTLNGTEKYKGIEFEPGTYTVNGNGKRLPLNRDFEIIVPSGANVTLGTGITANSGKVKIHGSGKLTLDGDKDFTSAGSRGIQSNYTGTANEFLIKDTNLTIKNFGGYGWYNFGATDSAIKVSGGSVTMEHCGYAGSEGGFEIEGKGGLTFTDGAKLSISNCGKSGFGPLYIGNGNLVFSKGATANILHTTSVYNAITLVSGAKMSVDGAGTSVEIENKGSGFITSRGVNGASDTTVDVINGGKLSVDSTANSFLTSALRNVKVNVLNGGIVDLKGKGTGLENCTTVSDTKSHVTTASAVNHLSSGSAVIEGGL